MDRLTIAALALLASVGAAVGQTVQDIPGPREVPPDSFRGAQYVDSGGCVFVRAGLDGRTIWVPRVNAQRKALCGYPPTEVTASGVAPAAPKAVAPVAAPAPATAPSTVAPTAGRPAPLSRTLTEPPDRPDRVRPVVPKGYKLAWKDDRLNPHRARGTAQGQAQQDRVWTRETPARLVTTAERAKVRSEASAMQVSTKASPGPARYVQIGTFADPDNARAAEARLSRIGLPAATGRVVRGGQTLQVVRAGPFAAEADARAALSALRRAGFPDALLK